MAKFGDKEETIRLRKLGKSYSEIKKLVKVSKSSLSLWLRDISLTEDQLLGLKSKKEKAIERYRESMRIKRQSKLNQYYLNQKKLWLPLSKTEIFIAGLFLYSGEGNKVSRNTISVANTDPSVVKFVLYWILNSLNVSLDKVRIQLHLYDDMDIEEETNYWMDRLHVNMSNFTKPYVKKSLKTGITQRGFGHGTCTILVHNTVLKENILMALKVIYDNYPQN